MTKRTRQVTLGALPLTILGVLALSALGFTQSGSESASSLRITGKLVGPAGQILGGATVIAVPELSDPEASLQDNLSKLARLEGVQSLPTTRAVSDAEGRFAIAPGDDARYRLVVVAAGFVPKTLRSVENPCDLGEVSLAVGVPLTGRVRTTSGAPLPGAKVEVRLSVASSPTADIMENVLASLMPAIWVGSTDRLGQFSCTSSGPLLDVAVTATARGHKPAAYQGLNTGPIEISLTPGATLSGEVIDPDGAPLEGASVRLTLTGACPPGVSSLREVVTDERGAFSIEGLSPTTQHRIVVDHPQYAPYRNRRFQISEKPARVQLRPGRRLFGVVRDGETGATIADARVELTEERDVVRKVQSQADGTFRIDGLTPKGQPDVSLVVNADGYAPSDPLRWKVREDGERREVALYRYTTASGTVIDQDAKPVAGAIVALRLVSGNLSSDVATTRSRKDGTFRFDQLVPGKTYFCRVTHPAWLEHDTPEFSVKPSVAVGPFGVRLETALSIHGVVRDTEGRPVPGAWVGVRGTSNLVERVEQLRRRAQADATGRFQIDGLAPGQFRLMVQAEGFRDLDNVAAQLTRGVKSEVVVTLEVSAAIVGRVVRKDGSPVEGAAVTVLDTSDGFVKHRVATDADGRFEVSGLGGAPVSVTVEKDGLPKQRLEEVPVGQSVEIVM